jgi:outer membrane protein
MKKLFTVITFSLIAKLAFAQGGGNAEAWTLQECIDYAIKNNIQVKQSELNMAQRDVELIRSKADLLPSLNSNSNLTYNVGRSINPFTNQFEERPVTGHNYGLNTNVVLFNGMQKINSIRRSNIEKEASWFDYEATKNNVSLNISATYIQILFNKEIYENAKKRLEVTQQQLERTEKLVMVGALPQANLLDLKAQKASDELAITNAENQLDLSYLQLKQLLQLPMSRNLNIVVPPVEVDRVVYPESADQIYTYAVDNQPAIKAAQFRVKSSNYSLEMAKANRMPTLTAFAGLSSLYSSLAPNEILRIGAPTQPFYPTIGYVIAPDGSPTNEVRSRNAIPVPIDQNDVVPNTYFNQLDFNFRYFMGLSLNIPIFNGYQVKTSIANATINQERARYTEIDAKNQLRQNIEQAYNDVRAAAKRYYSTLNRVESLQEVFRSNQQRLEAGVINAVDYNIAKNNLDIAESELIQAKYDYIFKMKVLDFYTGKPLTF